jgi:hypothetical protein
LSRQIEDWLSESRHKAEAMRQILEETRHKPWAGATASSEALPGDHETVGGLARLARDMGARTDQAGILNQLVSGAASCAQRVILFVVRNTSLTGWTASGFAPGFNPRGVSLSVTTDTILAQASLGCDAIVETPSSREGNTALSDLLGDPAPRVMMAAPIWVRDRVAAILYADPADTDSPWYPDAISVMASLAGLSLEALPYRRKHPRPVPGQPEAPETQEPQEARKPPAEPAVVVPCQEAVDPEELRLHEEARRFARLLISEIVLYNEAQVEEGRRHKDIYERLREEIDRSRQMYEDRISPRVLDTTDYFRQELVEVLAQGDESALALPWA